MQFRDLKAQYSVIKDDVDEAIGQVISDCNFISGKQVAELEEKLAGFVGVKHCITCANGTDALTLALMVWEIGEGDAVFVPDFTFFASGEVVSFEGATPVFVDVEKSSFNISPEKLEIAINKVIEDGKLRPRAIIAVDLFGQPADYPKIREIADKYHLMLLEDGAQGFGGKIGEKRACSFGDISTTSFFPAKPLGCYGDGGAIFTDNDDWATLIRSYAVHGKGSFKYDNIRIGMNSRLDTIQAAVLKAKFDQFISFELDAVNEAAVKYTEILKDIVAVPVIKESFYSSWAQYSILLENRSVRDGLQAYLKEQGIPTMVYYPKPMHSQQAFEGLNLYDCDFSNTIELCDRVLALPMHPYIQENDIVKVVENIKKFYR